MKHNTERRVKRYFLTTEHTERRVKETEIRGIGESEPDTPIYKAIMI